MQLAVCTHRALHRSGEEVRFSCGRDFFFVLEKRNLALPELTLAGRSRDSRSAHTGKRAYLEQDRPQPAPQGKQPIARKYSTLNDRWKPAHSPPGRWGGTRSQARAPRSHPRRSFRRGSCPASCFPQSRSPTASPENSCGLHELRTPTPLRWAT